MLSDVAPDVIVTAGILLTSLQHVLWSLARYAVLEIFRLGHLSGAFLNVATLFRRDGATCHCVTVVWSCQLLVWVDLKTYSG